MSLDFTSRRVGRLAAGIAGLAVLGLGVWTAIDQSMPDVGIVDGYWMVGGGLLAAAGVAPVAWRWRRERALLAVGGAAVAGAWLPLVVLALRAGMPVRARLKGAIFFSSADVIGLALPVGCTLLWLALQEHRVPRDPAAPP
ncbi:MAG: hypothetical protein IPI38_01025 [Gemmatimonadetes bacterium]|jgi:hypothetical protein|nr:hypothetical protein [Gemmatimonadota bacterium]MBP6668084.1 hypothetical protein [Gemmatimonadales bacterium]MBK6779251.1 hypothetical protein [Gemmatimonadota bacterium]MBK7348436.1 hypothetical protein [Gemmatimonadota bacterium]MBK7714006.1 hypothetical protein [Gemmatimonadota bacterium]